MAIRCKYEKPTQDEGVAVMDKHQRFKLSMQDAGLVPAPRGWVNPEDVDKIKSMLVKKTGGDGKINKSLHFKSEK